MNISIYVSYAADLLSLILVIFLMIRIGRLPARKGEVRKYFMRFSLVVLAISMFHLLESYAYMHLGIYNMTDLQNLSEADQSLWQWTGVSFGKVDIFLTMIFIYMWITFLSLSLFEDKDFVRRKFWFGFTPLIVGGVVSCISIPMAVKSEQGFWFFIFTLCLFFIIRIIYFAIGFWLLREYKIQNGYLRFFNPWVFFIPVFVGWLLQDVFYLGFSALGSTIGLLLAYESIVKVLRYEYGETGFYNMETVNYLKDLADKGRYEVFSAMTFSFDEPGHIPAFSEVLKKQLPKNCEPIVHNDREIVVLTCVHNRGPLLMVIEDVKAVSEVNAGCILKKKTETTQQFMERVLK